MRSGQVTVTTAGTAVQMTQVRGCEFEIKALPTNTGDMYVGADATNLEVASTSGYVLDAGESVIVYAADLSEFWVDSSVNGEKVCWMRTK